MYSESVAVAGSPHQSLVVGRGELAVGADNPEVRVESHIGCIDGPLAVTPLHDTQIREGFGLLHRFTDRRELGTV